MNEQKFVEPKSRETKMGAHKSVMNKKRIKELEGMGQKQLIAELVGLKIIF